VRSEFEYSLLRARNGFELVNLVENPIQIFRLVPGLRELFSCTPARDVAEVVVLKFVGTIGPATIAD
jgi:hypothetical protein